MTVGFFDRARAGYDSLAGRADQALDAATASRGQSEIDQYYRDLGLLTYLASTGRPVDTATQQHLVAVLRAYEERGAIRDFGLATTGRPPAGMPDQSDRTGGSDGIPQPPPERAGRHGDFLTQQRVEVSPQPPPGAPAQGFEQSYGEYEPGPQDPPSIGGTWGPPQQDNGGPTRWRPVRRDEE